MDYSVREMYINILKSRSKIYDYHVYFDNSVRISVIGNNFKRYHVILVSSNKLKNKHIIWSRYGLYNNPRKHWE